MRNEKNTKSNNFWVKFESGRLMENLLLNIFSMAPFGWLKMGGFVSARPYV
jgi:hypothetical protein